VPDDPRTFPQLVAELDYPLFIVTAIADEERSGCIVGFATQCSIHPPRFLTCLSNVNRTFAVAARADRLAVHLVPPDATELVELFGGETDDEIDKFSRCAWRPGPGGVPLLDDCPNWFVGGILERVAFGDHTGYLLEPREIAHGAAEGSYGYQRAKDVKAGHPPV
jgi:flavin reductase (DIM6/NTAB) family NADH-FMN oxidoreductase RutF